MTKIQFLNAFKYLRVSFDVNQSRLFLNGSVPYEITEALKRNPELEVELILREAVRNPDLLESIKERASIRWADGLSDSLYDAVLCNIKPIEEEPERDAEGKIILQSCTDWDMELKKYQ